MHNSVDHKFNSASNYYEAILQLRPYDKKVMDYIENQIMKNPNMFVSKAEELKSGIDLYFTDQKLTLALARKLKHVFKGEIKISKKLHTLERTNSKRVYRVTILFRLNRLCPITN